jgi:hypothetical protein
MAPAPPSGIHSTPLLTNIDTAAPAQQTASLNSEQNAQQRLVDFIAGLQAQGLTAQKFSTPAGLASEALRSLKGYFERANSLDDQMSRRVNGMNQNEDLESLSHAEREGQALPGGPASQTLEPAVTSAKAETDRVDKITLSEIERLCDELIEMAQYGAETAVVSTAGGNVSQSVMTLVRGQ